ncbi:HNH endonuclease [Ancylobacter sp. IITR112]|uniref:HNH endonuclease n=1 Tax=Ancylobacter sp. IITR112 TaxID=3138073 RepID=UPI00352BCB12
MNERNPQVSHEVTAEIAREFLAYNPETGVMLWQVRARKWFTSDAEHRSWNSRYAGRQAGTLKSDTGYRGVRIFGRRYPEHRLAWLIQKGAWPTTELDHINHRRDDNRWKNLRPVTSSENRQNLGRRRNGRLLPLGVDRPRARGRFRAGITVEGVRLHLGRFDTEEEAVRAREVAEIAAGYHPNHGRDVVEGEEPPIRIVVQLDY